MSMLEDLIAKKKKDGKEMDPMHKDAKMSVLKSLKDHMSGIMKGDLEAGKGQKVEVAAPDKAGLALGLEKAKEMVSGEEEPSEESSEDEIKMGDSGMSDSAEEVDEELMEAAEEASPEEIDSMIAKLEAIKQQKMSK